MMTSLWSGLGCLDVSSLAYNSLHVLVMVRRCCSAGSLRLCWDKGEMSGAWTVWTFWLTAGRSLFLLPVISLLIFLFLLSSLPSYIFNFHIKSLSPSFFLLPSLILYLSLSRLQCWLELSSTDSNRHWITINSASLDLPIVILLRIEEEGKEEKMR